MSLSVGIDLGTTHSAIAVVSEEEGILMVPNSSGDVLTPSVVGLSHSGDVLVGRAASARLLAHSDKTFAHFKRQMGTEVQFKLEKRNLTAPDLSAFVLKALKEDLAAKYDAPIGNLVISVPAYFNSTQRDATMLAAELAGLPEPRLINEPTAAALAYGLHERGSESTFIVLDLGGGTFDVSIIEMFEDVIEVRASSGDALLGGEDFTDCLARHLAEQAKLDWSALNAETRQRLIATAEQMKRHLSQNERAKARLELDKQEYDLEIDRTRFEEITAPLVLRLRRPIERCLYDSGLSPADIERVILVGGATRMPMIRSMAARLFRKLPESGVDPDLVVARGATVQAGLVRRHAALRDVVMTDVAPFSLGIATNHSTGSGEIRDAFAPIIERNTVLPASRAQHFWTIADNQDRIRIAVYQGEAPLIKDNVFIGQTMVNVPRAKRGEEGVEVRFSYDPSGLLTVDIKVMSTGKTSEFIIEGRASSLPPEERKKRLRALEALKIHPRENSANQEIVERLHRQYALRLGRDRLYIQDLIAGFEKVLEGQDPAAIEKARLELSKTLDELETSYVQ